MKLPYKNNMKYSYIFRFLNSFDLSSAIWVLYLVQKGLPLWQIGVIEGLFHIVSFLSEIPTGAAADLLGRKKVMILSRLCHTTAAIILLFSTGFWEFVIGFTFSAWGYNLLSGSEEALIYDSLKSMKQERSYLKISGRLEVILNIAQGIAALVGGILAQKSFYICYATAAFISILSLVPCFLLKEPILTEHKVKKKVSVRGHFSDSYHIVRKNPKVLEVIISYSVIFTIYMITYFYGQKYFAELGMNKVQISMIMTLTMGTSCIGALLCNKVKDLLKDYTKLLALFIIGLGAVGLAFGNIPLSIFCFSLMGFANTLLYPIQSDKLNRLIPSDYRATIISVNSMAYSLFMLLLFPVVGVIAERVGLNTTFAALGVGVVICSIGLGGKRLFKYSSHNNQGCDTP